MRFAAYKSDWSFFRDQSSTRLVVDEITSVAKLHRHFFDCLGSLGKIVSLDGTESIEELAALFSAPDVILTNMYGSSFASENPELRAAFEAMPKRVLKHTLGGLMYPDHILEAVAYRGNTTCLVTTEHQKNCIESALGDAAPAMGVFAPRLDIGHFRLPSVSQIAAARMKHGLASGDFHIVYAGRWLATKGLCQLLRCLSLWPGERIVVTFAGNFTPEFSLPTVSASHRTFESFINEEICGHGSKTQVRWIPALGNQDLRELFWSADLFLSASVHEDENFGLTPREAALSGVPVLATDFCGLHPLASLMPFGGIATYPTTLGVRYSLRELRYLIDIAAQCATQIDKRHIRDSVIRECDPATSKENLRAVATEMLSRTLQGRDPPGPGRDSRIIEQVFDHAKGFVLKGFLSGPKSITPGSFAYGCGPRDAQYPRNELFMAVQGIYTTHNRPPVVKESSRWRGFYRVSLWENERAVVEFGYPGLRFKRYDFSAWRALTSCMTGEPGQEAVFCPGTAAQIESVQELVDMAYLVPDDPPVQSV